MGILGGGIKTPRTCLLYGPVVDKTFVRNESRRKTLKKVLLSFYTPLAYFILGEREEGDGGRGEGVVYMELLLYW